MASDSSNELGADTEWTGNGLDGVALKGDLLRSGQNDLLLWGGYKLGSSDSDLLWGGYKLDLLWGGYKLGSSNSDLLWGGDKLDLLLGGNKLGSSDSNLGHGLNNGWNSAVSDFWLVNNNLLFDNGSFRGIDCSFSEQSSAQSWTNSNASWGSGEESGGEHSGVSSGGDGKSENDL